MKFWGLAKKLVSFSVKTTICVVILAAMLLVLFASHLGVLAKACAVVAIIATVVVWIDPANRNGK